MTDKPIKGIHVLMGLMTFFAIMFAVNGVFLFQSIQTFPGEETKKSYLQGLAFNETLAKRQAQAKLGWTAQVGTENSGERTLIVRMLDKSGNPIEGLNLQAALRIGGTAQGFEGIQLVSRSDGEYTATIPKALTGRTLVTVAVKSMAGNAVADDTIFEARKTINLS